MDLIKNKKVLAIAGIVLMIVGVFLPFFKITVSAYGYSVSETVSLSKGWEGWVIIALAISEAAFVFKELLKFINTGLINSALANKNNPKFCLIFAAASALILVKVILDKNGADFGAAASYATVSYSFGFYVLWVGIVCTVAHSFLAKPANKSGNNGGNSYNQPTFGQPMNNQPAQPTFGQPMNNQPTQPTFGQPMNNQPAQPTFAQPMNNQPAQPTFGQPMNNQPTQSTFGQPMNNQPVQPTQNQQSYNPYNNNNNF